MRIWAFGTSPHGLGLSSDALWRLTTREYLALRDVHDQPIQRWAIERVWYAEAHRDPQKDSMPWVVDDFLIAGHRQARRIEHEEMRRAVDAQNRKLLMMKPGELTDDIPLWARGKKA